MTISESLILNLYLIFKETQQLALGFFREIRDAIFHAQVKLTNLCKFLITRRRHTERILEAVSYSRVTLQEVLQTFRQTRDNHDWIILPLIHLHKEFVKRIHLIGILVGQEFLNIVEEQDAILGLLDILIPFIDEALVVHRIHHRQLRLLDNLMLVEVVTENLRKGSLSRTSLTYHDSIHRDSHVGNILT